jgi:hypothetical protein
MRRKIRKLLSLIIILLIVFISYMAIFNPDELEVIFSNVSIRIFNKNIFIDENEQLNDYSIINSKESKNKDYTYSTMYPYYELLDDNKKSIYTLMLEFIYKQRDELDLSSFNIDKDDLRIIFESILNDNPEIFWLDSKYSYTYLVETEKISVVKFTYLFNEEETKSIRIKIEEEANTIIAKVKDKKLDYEKEKVVHDELIKLIEYDESVSDDQTLYGALINKKAVCAGYVKSFQYIMMKLGIPTYYISGYADEDHAWNLVELEDGFYNVDLTWDDQADRIIYKYFNVSDELISKDHKRMDLSEKIIEAEGSKYANIYSTLKKD